MHILIEWNIMEVYSEDAVPYCPWPLTERGRDGGEEEEAGEDKWITITGTDNSNYAFMPRIMPRIIFMPATSSGTLLLEVPSFLGLLF